MTLRTGSQVSMDKPAASSVEKQLSVLKRRHRRCLERLEVALRSEAALREAAGLTEGSGGTASSARVTDLQEQLQSVR